ncbi:SDR family oxidoreductase [Roseococcus sp. SDR]|uniref:SDR family oxidoreductase n=1 Tax=Roseococcus sp. SDR TaxID=2835532 RepID=UPI001BCBACFA|nr:SDR family oxidoreductase [Roseococcus sp. SDR]MBS7790509.1 SDR family oxidoreductase [Roseococcus sp. SDR]MBV1845823.1 SDR family oxidoreductase [Roseococcus sp. SDR]
MTKVAWVTGAGSGIGEAAAIALAEMGMIVVLTGRTKAKLDAVAARIKAMGGTAHVKTADMSKAAAVQKVADFIQQKLGRLDVMVNNAGLNITERRWSNLSAEGVKELVEGNLTSAFHGVLAALPIMRAQKDGLFIHTASMAGRFVSPLSGAGYTASKHGVVAMSHSLNMEECGNGIRSTVMCPGEVRTPILDKRPNKLTEKELAEMVQPEDCGALVKFLASQPPHVCINEVLITPTRNRSYLAQMQRKL